MNRIILIGIIAALAAGAAGAADLTLTVDEAVELAVSRNLGLQQSGIELRTKERAKDKAWNVFLPSITATAGASGTGTNRIVGDSGISLADAGALGVNAGLNLSLPINIGIGAGIKNLVTDYEAGLLSYEDAQAQLERDVRQQFYSLLANEENIAIQQANIDLAEKRLEQARNNFANGLSPELDVLSAEVTVANLMPAYDGVVAGYESQMLFFKFLIGADRNDELTLVGELDTELQDFDAEALINTYMAGRFDLRGLEKQIDSLEQQKRGIARNTNTPTLSLGYNYALSGSNSEFDLQAMLPIDAWSDWGDTSTISLTLSWKLDGLIPGSSGDVALKELQDAIDSLEISKRMAYENAGIEITNLVNTLDTARKTIEANTSSVELARRNYELTEEAYNVGTRELLDVESAQNDLLAAQQQLLLAKYDYVAALLDLQYALNAPLEEFLD